MQFVGQAGSTAAVTCIELVPTKQTLQQKPSKEGTSHLQRQMTLTYFSSFVFFHFPELLPEIVQMLQTTIHYPA